MAVCWASCCAVSSATHCGVGISRNTRNKQSRAKLQLVLAEKPLQKLVDNIRFVVQRHNGAYMSYCIFLMCCLRLGSQNVLLPQLRRSLKLLHLMNVVSAASVLTASARGRLPWNRPCPAETISPQCFMYTLIASEKEPRWRHHWQPPLSAASIRNKWCVSTYTKHRGTHHM